MRKKKKIIGVSVITRFSGALVTSKTFRNFSLSLV
jgi:hypothetical protein